MASHTCPRRSVSWAELPEHSLEALFLVGTGAKQVNLPGLQLIIS